MYWLVDGFAGESHCRDLSCCWSPTALSDASVGKEYVRTLRTLGFVDIVCNLLHHNWPQISLPHVLTTNGAHLGRFEYPRLMSCRLHDKCSGYGGLQGLHALRTIHNHFHILHKTIHNLESLRRGRSSLFMVQSIQPLQHRFSLIIS